MFISFSTCHEVLFIGEIPKNAFSTSCPEVEELYLNYICQSLIPLSKSLKLSPYGKRT